MIYLSLLAGIIITSGLCKPTIKIKLVRQIPGKLLYIIFWGAILIFLVAFRSIKIGNDTATYEYIFNSMKKCPSFFEWTKMNFYTNGIEHGYYFLNYIFSKFTNFRFFLIFTAIVTISPYMYLIYKESKNITLSLILFIGLPYYTFFMSGLRQSYALAFIVPAYYFLKEKKLINYLITCVIAMSFHSSALIFVPVYWIVKLKNTKKTRMFLISFIILFWVFRNQIWNIATLFARQQYDANDAGGEMMCVFLVLSAIIGFYYRRNFLENENGEKELFYLQALTAMVAPFSLVNSALYRIYFYFNIFIILYVPCLAKSISRKNERYIIVLGYVVIAVAFLVKIVMNPDQHYYPYYFMWQ